MDIFILGVFLFTVLTVYLLVTTFMVMIMEELKPLISDGKYKKLKFSLAVIFFPIYGMWCVWSFILAPHK